MLDSQHSCRCNHINSIKQSFICPMITHYNNGVISIKCQLCKSKIIGLKSNDYNNDAHHHYNRPYELRRLERSRISEKANGLIFNCLGIAIP
ncbi:hypothetical protein DERP_002982 [Dermatophagoides pteronyssinus]|uniref:Uncharacterized protein n=1 Tax=Dermatophagoides pteronyssinus TaxID=6956 RepID=A0ABQ8JX71_DERPT|nr:hypothetical protein DERP_002982 [Dermatophagoides pteronyssinus]